MYLKAIDSDTIARAIRALTGPPTCSADETL